MSEPHDPNVPNPQYPGLPPGAYPVYVRPPETNGLAIAAMVVSLVSVSMCPFPLGIVGALMGRRAKQQIAERGEGGEQMAKIGIIVGWIQFGLAMTVILFYVVIIILGVSGVFDDTSSTY